MNNYQLCYFAMLILYNLNGFGSSPIFFWGVNKSNPIFSGSAIRWVKSNQYKPQGEANLSVVYK